MTSGQARLRDQLVAALRSHLADGTPPRVPEAGALAWQWFADLSSARSAGPITFGEIEAYASLHRWPLEAHHVAIIRALDAEFLRIGRAQAASPKNRRVTGNVTPAAFDAVFRGGG
jgi:hypothetical protein